jgi:hypothetical protein
MAEVADKEAFPERQNFCGGNHPGTGRKQRLHTHSNSYVFSVLEGSTCEVTDRDGKSCGSLTMEPDFTLHFELQGSELLTGGLKVRVLPEEPFSLLSYVPQRPNSFAKQRLLHRRD